MRALFAGLTTRGKSFLAAGSGRAGVGLASASGPAQHRDRAAGLLPLLAALATSRARYRIRCARRISPPRVPAGPDGHGDAAAGEHLPAAHGLLLAEDTVPYSLGTRPRFVLERIERAAGAS